MLRISFNAKSICYMINFFGCAITAHLGYHPVSDTVIVDSKRGDDKGGSLFGCCRQRLFDFRSYFAMEF